MSDMMVRVARMLRRVLKVSTKRLLRAEVLLAGMTVATRRKCLGDVLTCFTIFSNVRTISIHSNDGVGVHRQNGATDSTTITKNWSGDNDR
jgi:hypothetical protein